LNGPPPVGAAPRALEIDVRFAPAGESALLVQVDTPAGPSGWQELALPMGFAEADSLARRALLGSPGGGRGEEPARQLGRALFASLFADRVLGRYRATLGPSRAAAPPLRLRFLLAAGDEALAGLHRLPWEILCEPGVGEGRLLALDRRLSVVRQLEVPDGVTMPPRPARLRVLLAAAEGRAPGVAPLDLGGEIAAVEAACRGSAVVELEVLRPATLEALVERLRGGGFHFLHLSGHGDLAAGGGALFLPGRGGRLVACDGELLAIQLDGLSPLRLVVLNACRTAEAVAGRPFAGVATALLGHGLPAAVAMQAPIADGAAALFAATLYRHLAAGATLDAAVAEGRLAMLRERRRSFEWAVPVLFSRLPGTELFAAPKGEGEGGGEGEGARLAGGERRDAQQIDEGGGGGEGSVARPRRWRRLAAVAAIALVVVVVAAATWGLLLDGWEPHAAAPGGDQEESLPDGGDAPPPASPALRGRQGGTPGGEDTEAVAPPTDPRAEPPRQPVEEPPAVGDERMQEPAPRLPADPPPATGFCDRVRTLRSGDAIEIPEIGVRLAPRIAEHAAVGQPYVTVAVFGPGRAATHATTFGPARLDLPESLPLAVEVLGFEPSEGTIRLSCEILSAAP
jgi:hypothetical protein